MDWQGIPVCCPRCRGELGPRDTEALVCTGCGSRYPVICEIPDLRVFDDPYIALEPDRAKARRIAERFPADTFEELVDYYYSITPEVPPADRDRFKRGILGGMSRASAAMSDAGWSPRQAITAPVLDLGCGTAGGVIAVAPARVVGVDIALRWLVIARKRLAERGLSAPLISACAEALPFPDETIGSVICLSALEHFRDPARALGEAARVLRGDGRILLSTPNRLSPGPDPHTGLWGGSLLPARVTAAYMRRRGALPPVRHLMSARGLGRLLRQAGFSEIRVRPPTLPATTVATLRGLTGSLARVYQRVAAYGAARGLLTAFGPALLASAVKTTGVPKAPAAGPA